MVSPLDNLKALLAREANDWTPEDRATALTIGADLTQLLTRELAGEDVAGELAIANASAQNLAVGAVVSGARLLGNWVLSLISAFLLKAVGV